MYGGVVVLCLCGDCARNSAHSYVVKCRVQRWEEGVTQMVHVLLWHPTNKCGLLTRLIGATHSRNSSLCDYTKKVSVN